MTAMMTKSLEDYIEKIYMLITDSSRARVRDVAEGLHVTMPSVNKAVSELKKLGLVRQEPYGDLELTSEGVRTAAEILGRHTLLRRFLTRLGVSRDVAEEDACRMEHILSAETYDRIRVFLGDEP